MCCKNPQARGAGRQMGEWTEQDEKAVIEAVGASGGAGAVGEDFLEEPID